MYSFKISEPLQITLEKLGKKDKQVHSRILAKMEEIITCDTIDHYKNLRYNMKDSKRVHIGHFVLVFQYNKEKKEIYFDDFDHHNNIYKNK